jgi:hypothetical protein
LVRFSLHAANVSVSLRCGISTNDQQYYAQAD